MRNSQSSRANLASPEHELVFLENRRRNSLTSSLLDQSRSSSGTPLRDDISTSSEEETKNASVLRGFGLEIFYSLYLCCRRKPLSEPKKVAVSISWLEIVMGFYIHIIPVAAAIGIATLNLRGHFIGADLAGAVGQNTAKLNAIQFASKLHELTMHASIATVILSIVRYKLMDGKVLPFGAIFAGLQFKEISFLWSAEFWGLALSREMRWGKRLFLLSVIIVSTLLAVSVGPASAIAMQPRLEYFSAGGSSLWLNATSKDFWPDRLDSSSLPGSYCQNSDASECPSGDWRLIRDYMGFLNGSSYSEFPFGIPAFPDIWAFPCPHGYRQMSRGLPFGYYNRPNTFTFMPHYAISGASTVATLAWAVAARNVSSWRYKYRNGTDFGIETKDAFATAHCSPPTIVRFNQTTIGFPSLAPHSLPDEYSWLSDISSTTPANTEFRFRLFEDPRMTLTWIPNPSDRRYVSAAITFSGRSLPGVPIRERNLLTCSVSSCWANSTLGPWRGNMNADGMHVAGSARDVEDTDRVIMTAEWLSALNPFIRKENDSVFNLVAAPVNLGAKQVKYAVELILAAMVTNGMSRLGYNATFQPEFVSNWQEEFMRGGQAYRGPNSNHDWLEFVLKMRVHGYAYIVSGKTDKVACIILFLYSSFAIIHLLWVIIYLRMSSRIWASAGEVTVLAMNSKPTPRIKNTCAGVLLVDNYSAPIRILETDAGAGGMTDHLEIVFGRQNEGADNNENDRCLKKDKFYG